MEFYTKNMIPNYPKPHYISSGLLMMQYILENFGDCKIDAYGFSFFKDKELHYFGRGDNKRANTLHDSNLELTYFNEKLSKKINLKI